MPDDPDVEKQPLQPIEPYALLKNLQLTTGKAAELCGVSRRQLCYWTDTGIISATEGEEEDGSDPAARRSYDFDALHRVLLIKRALEQSAGLRRAAREVDHYLTQRRLRAEELANSIAQKREEFLTEQADKLETIVSQIRQLAPQLNDRDQLLEEDAQACLRLASLAEQAEAKLDALSSSAK
jgi:DNA-binding transcriptional MerR regulator